MYLLRVMDNIGHSCRQNIPNHEHPQRFAKTPSPWQGSITPLINMSGWGEIGFQFLPLTFVTLRHFFPKPFQEIYSNKRLFGKVNFVTHAIRRLCNQISGFLLDIMYMNICQWYDNRCYIDDCIWDNTGTFGTVWSLSQNIFPWNIRWLEGCVRSDVRIWNDTCCILSLCMIIKWVFTRKHYCWFVIRGGFSQCGKYYKC